MALTAAERQRRRRERLKKEGTSRRDWILEPDELRMLGEICVLRRPGRVPYSENEVIGLLIRKNYKELQKQVYEDRSIYPLAFPNYVFAVRSCVKGADTIRTAPIFEDFSKLSIEK